MFDDKKFEEFTQQFNNLLAVAKESELRTTRDPVDSLFEENLNVFTKSYIVSACSILEAFIQDITFSFAIEMEKRISAANIPRNLLIWSLFGESKKSDFKFEAIRLEIKKKDISDIVSGNFFKTIKVFEKVGIDIEKEKSFQRFSDSIGSTVDKRNKIVHHNDKASDITMTDVINIIENFKKYAECIFNIVKTNSHLA